MGRGIDVSEHFRRHRRQGMKGRGDSPRRPRAEKWGDGSVLSCWDEHAYILLNAPAGNRDPGWIKHFSKKQLRTFRDQREKWNHEGRAFSPRFFLTALDLPGITNVSSAPIAKIRASILTFILTLAFLQFPLFTERLIFKAGIGVGAGEGNRTLVSGLGSPRSTIEPHPLPVACL